MAHKRVTTVVLNWVLVGLQPKTVILNAAAHALSLLGTCRLPDHLVLRGPRSSDVAFVIQQSSS